MPEGRVAGPVAIWQVPQPVVEDLTRENRGGKKGGGMAYGWVLRPASFQHQKRSLNKKSTPICPLYSGQMYTYNRYISHWTLVVVGGVDIILES